jgi:hypothetical protein
VPNWIAISRKSLTCLVSLTFLFPAPGNTLTHASKCDCNSSFIPCSCCLNWLPSLPNPHLVPFSSVLDSSLKSRPYRVSEPSGRRMILSRDVHLIDKLHFRLIPLEIVNISQVSIANPSMTAVCSIWFVCYDSCI